MYTCSIFLAIYNPTLLMNTCYTSIFLLCSCLFLFTPSLSAQGNFTSDPFQIWTDLPESDIKVIGKRQIIPDNYRTLRADLKDLKSLLATAPLEGSQTSPALLSLPFPDGSFQTFSIVESPIMAPALAVKFPEIKTYIGQGIEDGTATVRLDMTPKGFHAMILRSGGSIFIDPYSSENQIHYLSYFKQDFHKNLSSPIEELPPIDASLENQLGESINSGTSNGMVTMAGDCQLRTYRLALACTGEYATFHGGTVAAVMAAFTTSMNRVNGLYEREVAVRMEMVANNDLLIQLNAGTDPYTNNNGGTMLGENIATVDAIIGSGNYDIGHVFSTGGGGVAYLNSPCNNAIKAGGVTGLPAPVGDPFDIDYVCHEMGHQFGGNHTQNNACNRSAASYEPGSASTIMGYAGICAPNVQNNSDDYFHAISIQEIQANITTGTSSTCPVVTALANTAPVAAGGLDYTLPVSTPFALTASAIDPDPDVLTYCWEQFNNDVAVMPPAATSIAGPNFRTFDPTTDPVRYFPRLADLVNNVVPVWEVLPSVSRTMDFRITVRDNVAGGACTGEDDILLTFSDAAGPFVILSPNTFLTWIVTGTETVTWDVANTDAAPVSCANVDILLSLDGGFTYPVVLATNVPNDGAHPITVPNNITATARVKVVCSDNIFYDISDTDFEIVAPTIPDFSIVANPTAQTVCGGSNGSATVDIGAFLSFADPVTLSVTGAPAGITPVFSANPIIPGNASTLTLTNDGSGTPGTSTLTVSGTSTTGTKSVDITLTLSDIPALLTAAAPANGATGVSLSPTLSWAASAVTGTYEIEISANPTFTPVLETAAGITANTYTLTTLLSGSTAYYWRIRQNNSCGTGPWSVTSAFQTDFYTNSCATYVLNTLALRIPPAGTAGTTTSTLAVVTPGGFISDVNVVLLEGTHSWMADLEFSLFSPTGTEVELMNQVCTDNDDFDIQFDDAAAAGAIPCPPTNGNAYQPVEALADFNGENPDGNWVLEIEDLNNGDIGELQNWGLEICLLSTNPSANQPPALLTNNPLDILSAATGQITDLLLEITDPDHPPIDLVFTLLSVPASGTLFLNATALNLGDTFTQDDIDNGLFSYQHNGNTAATDNFIFSVADGAGGWFGTPTFTINIQNTVLPASLTQLEAHAKGSDILVAWKTQQEINTDRFEVQLRSIQDSTAFEMAGFVSAAGNSESELSYQFNIPNNAPERYEIRLRQLDLDGRESLSNVIEVQISTLPELVVRPIPVQETLFLEFFQEEPHPIRLDLFDAQGQLVHKQHHDQLSRGAVQLQVEMESLPTGMYFYRIMAGAQVFQGKVLHTEKDR